MIGSPGRLNLVAQAPGANPRARNYQGANLLANSFRPFFLFGAIQAGSPSWSGCRSFMANCR
jgi:hypothetical protein